jgi:AhpD family alkylhydroperoxidase
MAAAVNIHAEIPDTIAALAAAQAAVSAGDLEPKLRHLVTLRASQLNGCAFCIKMHVREALEDGETHDRLHRLVGWRHMTDFTPAEKAALAWTEALTVLTPESAFADLRAALRDHYTDRQIAQLTATVAMINLWNRVQAAGH